MLKHQLNKLALKHLGRQWVDYLASNTMTEFNRRHNDFLWTYDLKALVENVREEAPGVKTFTLLPNQHWKHMKAGQHIEVMATVEGQQVSRYYSLSPIQRGRFTITVKQVEGGALSTWLHQNTHKGSVLHIRHPEGQFTYRQQRKLLFICAGSGITPCYSMISDCLTLPERPDLALYAQFSHTSDTLFSSTLTDWKSRFDVRVAYSREAHHPARLLSSAPLREQYPDLDERDVYLCGPQGFMDQVIAALTHEGYDPTRLHCERFVAQTWEVSPSDAFDPSGAEVHFEHLDEHICLTPGDRGRTFMEIAESRGLNLEVGCRQGMCGTCKLTLQSGAASGNVLGHAVYLCSAYPASTRVVLSA